MTIQRCHLGASIAVEPGVGHVIEKVTRRVNACVVPPRLSCHSHHSSPLPHSGELPACCWWWGDHPTAPPTAIPHTHTPTHFPAAAAQYRQTNKMTCGRSPKLRCRNEIPPNAIKPLSRSTYQVCLLPGPGSRSDNCDNATTLARQ